MRKVIKLLNKYSILLIGVLLMTIPLITTQYQFYVAQRGVQNAVLVLGLVILIGYSGMMTLGSAALLATGGYAYAIILVNFNISPWLAALLAILITAMIGTLLAFPAFSLSGPFLMVVTIGFGETVRILILNLESLTGGAYGIDGYAKLLPSSTGLYYLMVFILVITAVATKRIGDSQLGLSMKAIRQDDVAAQVMGVSEKRVKVLSYFLSSLMAGLSGVILANLTGYLSPDSFTANESSTYLLMVVMGGLDNVAGAIVSSFVLTLLPEVLRFLAESRLLVYSLVLLVYIRFKYVKPKSGGIIDKLQTKISASKSKNRS